MAFASAALHRDFDNGLALAKPCVRRLAPCGWLLAGLFLLCLIPRVVEAWKIDTLCKDGVFYLTLAEGFERGDLEAGLGRLRLNTYPPILAALHRCGLDWETAAEIWGVLISSLAVLPLFGWVRRQFDERVATAACILYAVHPKLIEWSPETIRDSTFWFVWALSLYAAWRAATEVKLSWFLAAGAATTLALHTRFEGWFLYLPLVWWSACRYPALARAKWKIAAGLALAVSTCPALLLLVNVTWLRHQPRWELGNFARLEYVVLWYQAATRPEQIAPVVSDHAVNGAGAGPVATEPAPPRPVARADLTMPRMPTRKTALAYANALRRGIGGMFGVMWLIGFLSSPRFWLRRDHLVLFGAALCVAAGIWIHLWYAQATSSRYFLAIVLLASACAGIGWLKSCEWLSIAFGKLGADAWALKTAVAAMLLLAAFTGVGQAVTNRYDGRQRDAALGKWLERQYGLQPRLATSGSLELVDHYARALAAPLPADREAAARLLADFRPLCVVLSRHAQPAGIAEEHLTLARSLGFEQVEIARLPQGFNWKDLVVMERPPPREMTRALTQRD